VEFVWAVVVVEPDDWVRCARDVIVECVLHTLHKAVRLGDAKEPYLHDGPVVVGDLLISQHDDVVCHPRV
jgi:hypothetical protein